MIYFFFESSHQNLHLDVGDRHIMPPSRSTEARRKLQAGSEHDVGTNTTSAPSLHRETSRPGLNNDVNILSIF